MKKAVKSKKRTAEQSIFKRSQVYSREQAAELLGYGTNVKGFMKAYKPRFGFQPLLSSHNGIDTYFLKSQVDAAKLLLEKKSEKEIFRFKGVEAKSSNSPTRKKSKSKKKAKKA